MKQPFLVLLTACALCSMQVKAAATVLAQWNFNSVPPDGSASTGTTAPSIGAGTASVVGTTSQSFATGDTAHDPAPAADNSGWHTTSYPAASSPSRGGVRFDVNTSGYENISISWYQRNSTTASRYGRLQYTVDGINFTDADVITITADSVYVAETVSLATVPAVANAPTFGFRIVAEWESAATGSGSAAYVATKTGSTYGTIGTWRFDMVTVSGTPIAGGNTPPSISSVPNQTIRVNQSSGEIPFTIGDGQDAADSLALSAASSAPSVIPVTGVTFGGSDSSRTVKVSAGNQVGASTITVYVTDSGGLSSSTSFLVTVLPANTAPVISPLARTNTILNRATLPIPLTVSDLETPASDLTLSAVSANPALVPDRNIVFGGSGSNRTVTVTPATDQLGVALITVSISDGTNSASSAFSLMVTPSSGVIFYEPFSYADGSIVTNSGALWTTRSGTIGQCQVASGQLHICGTETEDVVGTLIGAPYTITNGTVLYSSFKVNFLSLPNSAPGLFAHFCDGSTLRGRILAGTVGASSPGSFRLYVANGSSTVTALATDLQIGNTYTIVSRYSIDTATTTLWVNPASESSPGATASDTQSAARITQYGFRQDSELGGATMLIDDLKVGLSFSAVAESGATGSIPMNAQRDGDTLILTWSDPLFNLQSAPAPDGAYTDVPGATSPYATSVSGTGQFFRLKHQ